MHEDSGLKDLTTGSTAIQTAAKQTSFLQRHVSAKAERAERHTHKLSETNLNSLEPRKEQRIDPKGELLPRKDCLSCASVQKLLAFGPATIFFADLSGQKGGEASRYGLLWTWKTEGCIASVVCHKHTKMVSLASENAKCSFLQHA